MSIMIKDIPKYDRPIERLINNGADSLSDRELLTIIINTGTKNESAADLASHLLKNINSIQELKNYNLEKLKKIKGIGTSKAAKILATIELSNRINRDYNCINNLKITDSSIVFNYYKNKIGDKKQEFFYCIYLDNSKKIISDKLLFIGTINQSIIHPREIFKYAYELSASSIICVHNHPSGSIFPSSEDIKITNKINEIGLLMGIKLIDHVIITNDNYYSFFENNDIR